MNLVAPLAGIDGAKMAGRIQVKIEQAVQKYNEAALAKAPKK